MTDQKHIVRPWSRASREQQNFGSLPSLRRRAFLGSVGAFGLYPAISNAQNAEFPTKPIRLIVANPPGGTADTLSRALAEGMTKSFGQPVVVENRPGANGNVAAEILARSAADGYTLLVCPPGPLAVNASLYASLPFNPQTAFSPVTLVGVAPLVLVVSKKTPANNLPELLAYLKLNKTLANYASQGNASSGHLAMELLKNKTGMEAVHVPYKGSAPALNDVLAGHIFMMFDNTTSCLPHIRSGALKAIAVAEEKRLATLPDVPTVIESGVPGFSATPWFGLSATGGTPSAVVARLNAVASEVLRAPALQAQFAAMGVELRPISPGDFERFIKAESAKWKDVIRVSGAQID